MEKQISKMRYILCAVLAVLIAVMTVLSGRYISPAFADTDIVTAFENTNVLDDLTGSTIGGNKFNLEDYPHTDNGAPQLISFVEFGYSLYANNRDDYGLYAYVYNPQDKAIDINGNNKIQLACGNNGSYSKYALRFINYSTKASYEGRFYKFRVTLTYEVEQSILNSLDDNSRIYKVSGIELSYKNEVTEYLCAQTYTYSGFAKGYGSELAEGDTLTCIVDGLDKYIELDVKHTQYRPQGDYYNGEQSQLNSCYFRIPNKYLNDYGALSKILCEWYEYFTKPILVTEDNYIYNKINALHGGNTSDIPDDMYFLFEAFWQNCNSSWFSKSGIADWTSNYGYEVGDSYSWGFLWSDGVEIKWDSFPSFAAAFYTGDKSYKDYEVDGNALKQKLLANSEYLGGELLNNRYSKALFEDYVQDGYDYGYNKKPINADDMFDVFWHITTKDFWQTVFGGYDVRTVYDSKKAIEILSDNDFSGSNSEIANTLYVNENDVPNIKTEYAKAKAADESLVLFRYSTTQYMCAPCISSYCRKADIDGGKTLVKDIQTRWKNSDFNAYVVQETVYLDFDIISLWFTSDGVETEIPVVHSPTDVIAGITPPLDENYHNTKYKTLWILIAIIILLLVLMVTGLLPLLVKAIIWIITAPFKAIAACVKSAKKNKKGR